MLDKLDLPSISLQASAVSAAGSAISANADMQLLGVPLAVLLAGFAGATLALSLLPKMPLPRAMVAVALGTFAACYGTPIFAVLSTEWAPALRVIPHPPFAFFAGLLAQLVLSWGFKRLPAVLDKRTGLGEEK